MTAEQNRTSTASSLPDQLPMEESIGSSWTDEVVLPKIKAKPMKKTSKQLQRILDQTKPSPKKYFTSGRGITQETAIDVTKEPSPYKYPADLELFAHKVRTKAWRKDVKLQELQQKISQRTNDKQKNLLPRLFVEEPDPVNMSTVLDIDPEYYSIIAGRPIPDNLDIRTYIETVRETLRTKIVTGYREDDIMLIEENILLEQKMIDTIRANLQKYINTFEEFLYRDHSSAMNLLKEADQATRLAYDKYEEYKHLEKKFGALRSSLYNSEEKWRNCKMYQKFLYVMSPLEWRQKTGYRRNTVYMIEDEDDDDNIFGTYKLSLITEGVSLTEVLEVFREESKLGSPTLYFTEPSQLMDVFHFMEMQNLNSLLHCEELAIPLDQVKNGMRYAAAVFDREIHKLEENIEKLSGGILWEEERARYLEDLARKLIQTEFKRVVMDDEVLNMLVFVEDVYETRVGPNDANLGILEMMKGIEEKYRIELLQLDKLPAEQVQILEGSCFQEQIRIMRLAERASRQYAELERLTNNLIKSYEPPFQKPLYKELKKRSPVIEIKKVPPPPPRGLTDSELEYLEFFTDFCAFTDNPKDYGIGIEETELYEIVSEEEDEEAGAHQTITTLPEDRKEELPELERL